MKMDRETLAVLAESVATTFQCPPIKIASGSDWEDALISTLLTRVYPDDFFHELGHVLSMVDPEDFGHPMCQELFWAIAVQYLDGDPMDWHGIADYWISLGMPPTIERGETRKSCPRSPHPLSKAGLLQIIYECTRRHGIQGNEPYYCRKIQEAAHARRLQEVLLDCVVTLGDCQGLYLAVLDDIKSKLRAALKPHF